MHLFHSLHTNPRLYRPLVRRWERSDGRVSYPIVMIYYAPREGNPYLSMMYSSSKVVVCNAIDVFKVCARACERVSVCVRDPFFSSSHYFSP